MDTNIVSYRNNINRAVGKRSDGKLLDYDEAEKMIIQSISDSRKDKKIETEMFHKNKTKEDLRTEMLETRKIVVACILENNMSIRNYQEEKILEFIEDMVQEYGGYSALDEAFNDDDVSDIYCLSWDSIFVEKKGKNEKYHKKFRSPIHYKNVVERFCRTSGKEINNGENKIVDFELYQDRGCATSPVVSPNGYSITIRKHSEDHIILDQLLEWQCMNEEMKDFFGVIIDGEGNLIYAGITGSGKTTTIRALIDYFVTKNNKRMLVCEDTQELFPKNEHTVSLISIKSDKESTSIPLDALIITALRLKPKYIVVGEVRGKEAMAAVEAMETGHSTLFTMHGGTVINIVNRLVTKYLMAMPELGIDVVERIIGSAVDYVAIQDDIPNIGRKVSILSEVNYDFEIQRVVIKPIFKFDFETNDFLFLNRIDAEKATKFMRRGVDYDRIKPWIETGNKEEDEAYVAAINEKYIREKPARLEEYAKRKTEREASNKEAADLPNEYKQQVDELNRRALQNEIQKMQEHQRIVDKVDRANS